MNVTIENLAPCRKLVRVELDPQAVDSAYEKITSEFQREARLPGFRPGKAPRHMVAKTFAPKIEDEVKRKLISESYSKALEENKIRVVGYPDIEEIQFGRGQALQFAATVETAPEFEAPEYKGIQVKRESRTVQDEDVSKALEVLRQQKSEFKDVARPIQEQDIAVVNYKGTSEGKPLTDIAPTARGLTEKEGFWLLIKQGSFIPGFTEQLIGAQPGEHRTVEVEFPVDFVAAQLGGRKGTYEVDIVQVKEKVLPELNDAFAKALGADSVEALKEGVRKDLERELAYKLRRSVHQQIIQSLLDRVAFELPESMVTSQTRNVIYDIVRENQERGVPKEVIDQQKDEIFNAANNSAKEKIKATFILNQIALKEGIQVEQQEITQRVLFLADQYQIRPEKFIKQLQERNGIAAIHEEVLNTKVMAMLEKSANIEEVPPAPAPQG